MTNGRTDKWFTFLLALIIILLSGLGGMVLTLHSQSMYQVSQLWVKLDRVTALLLSERDILKQDLSKACEKVSQQGERLAIIEGTLKNNHKTPGNNK